MLNWTFEQGIAWASDLFVVPHTIFFYMPVCYHSDENICLSAEMFLINQQYNNIVINKMKNILGKEPSGDDALIICHLNRIFKSILIIFSHIQDVE